ncbi:hypothetical protein FIBSPDRAFT_1038015 [Athelia psychrophila]|uniref:Uncharacterized protein n=1 Tax=Athelia psychrophila TaxID=1759441 RepID=A0A166TLW7_9AGAM|nr:hypothetical protein FIBSPDRAFT_1038015 [Fibularhizoctonia sp. CBS 109695]
MSGIPPPTRRRAKTGGLSDFFGSGSSRQTPKHPQAPTDPPSAPPPMPPVPSMHLNSQPESSSSSIKGKKSSIPFWKKKDAPPSSIPSPASILKRKSTTRLPTSPPLMPPPLPPRSSATYGNASGPSSLNSSAGRTSFQTQASPREATFPSIPAVPRHSTASTSTSPASRPPPLTISPAASTLSSKFAAHFTPSKAPKNANAHVAHNPNTNVANANIAIATKRERERERAGVERERGLSTSIHAPSYIHGISPPHSPKTAQGQGQSPRTSHSPRGSSIPTSAGGMSSIPSPTGSAFKFPRSKPTEVGPPPSLSARPSHGHAHTHAQSHALPTPPPSASTPAPPPLAPTPASASIALNLNPPPLMAPRLTIPPQTIPPHTRPPSPARSSTSTTRPTFTAPNAPTNYSPTSPTATRSDNPASNTSHMTSAPTPLLSISPPEELFKDEGDDFEFCTPRTAPTPPGTSPTLPAVHTPKELRQRRGTGTGATTPGSMKEREVKEVAGREAVAGYFDVSPAPAQMLGFATPSPPSSPWVQFSHPPGLGEYSQHQQSGKGKGKAKTDEFGALVAPSTSTHTKKSARKHSISVVRALENALGTSLAVDLESSDDDSGGVGSDSDDTIPSHDVPPSSTSMSVGSLGVEGFKPPSRRSSLVMLEQYQQQQQAASSTLSVSRTPSSSSMRVSPTKAKVSPSSHRSQVGPPPSTPLPSTPGASTPPAKDFTSSPASHQMAMGMGSLAINPSVVGFRRQSALSPMHRDAATPRPRAQTIGVSSTPDVKAPSAMSTASRSLNSSNDSSRRHSRGRIEDLMLAAAQNSPPPKEKRKMTYEEMEIVLADCQDRYKALTAYLETVTDKLEREKALQADEIEGLRHTADELQREAEKWKHEAKMRSTEAKKRELEIGGLKWLIMHPIPPSGREEKELEYDDDASTDVGSRSATPIFVFSNDSGVISQSRAAQALRKRSTTISDFRPSPPPMRKPKSPSLLSYSSNHSSVIGFGLGIDYTVPDLPYTNYLPDSSLSTSSSASSSTTSLGTPSLTASNTVSSGLSAIPESPPSSSDDHSDLSAQTHVDHGQEEKRSSRVTRQTSGSSLASSSASASTAASASVAYASNLKTGRGPSIEQVLDATPPTMEEVMEKLRPFGNS